MDAGRFYALLRFEEAALALRAALKLGIVERIGDRELAMTELQQEFGFSRQSARTYFALLHVMGILERTSSSHFRIADLAAECLCEGKPGSRKPYLAMGTGDEVQQFINLMKGQNEDGSIPLYGSEDDGQTLMDNDVVAREVSYGLASRARNFAQPLAEALSRFVGNATTLADVGAGSPFVAKACLDRCDSLESAILVDRANGMRFAREIVEASSWEGAKIQFHEADFFGEIPEADIFILSNTAHDWTEEEYSRIISNIVSVMPSHGIVGIHEPLLTDTWESESEWIHALWMACYAQTLLRLTLGKGTCYTADEHKLILADHGLQLAHAPIPTADGCSLMVFKRRAV